MAEIEENSPHKIKIRRNLHYLTSNTVNLEKLLVELHCLDVLSKYEVERIKSCKSNLEKNMDLYTTIYYQSKDSYEKLIIALANTGNDHVRKKLLTRKDNNTLPVIDNPMLTSANISGTMMMKFFERRSIFRHFEYITSSTSNLLEVLVHLQERDVLTVEEHEKILAGKTDKFRKSLLYITLLDKRPNPYAKLIQVLIKTGNEHIADKLETPPEKDDDFTKGLTRIKAVMHRIRIDEERLMPVVIPDNIWFGMRGKLAKEKFIGRAAVLERLEKSIKSQDEEAKLNNQSKFTVLCGLSGIGKSETVRQYVYRFHSNDNVIWINAENVGSMTESFCQVANYLHIDPLNQDGKRKNIQQIINEVYDNISYRKTVLVFDNAENSEEFCNEHRIDPYLPILLPNRRRPHVIVTSQNNHWPSLTQTWEIIEMDALTKSESILFIREYLGMIAPYEEMDPFTKDEIMDLTLFMKGHPLALHQALGYISRENANLRNTGAKYQITQFLEEFLKEEKQILNHNPYVKTNPHLLTVFTTWKMTVTGILESENHGEEAIKILNVMAYYNSYGIHSQLFPMYQPQRKKLGMILGVLQRYSLITISDGIIDVHGLLQQVSRINLQENQAEESTLELAIEYIDNFMPREMCGIMEGDEIGTPHAHSVWNHAIKYSKLVCDYHEVLGLTIADCLKNGWYEMCRRFTENSVPFLEAEFGVQNEEAMKMKVIVLLVRIRLGENSDENFEFLRNLSDTAKSSISKNPKTETEKLTLELLERASSFHGTTTEYLKSFMKDFSQLSVAVKQEDAQKPNNDDWNISVPFQLIEAAMLEQTGNYDKSLSILESIIRNMTEAKASLNNPLLVKTKITMAGVLNSLGRNQEALSVIEQAGVLNNKTVENENFSPQDMNAIYAETLVSYDEGLFKRIISKILQDAGRNDDALEILGYKKSSANSTTVVDEQKTDSGNPNQQQSSSNNLKKQSKKVNAETLALYVNIGVNLIAQGKYSEAVAVLEEHYATSLETCGRIHNTTVALLSTLALALDRSERFDDALDKSQEMFECFSILFGDDHEQTQSILIMISELIEKRDRILESRSKTN